MPPEVIRDWAQNLESNYGFELIADPAGPNDNAFRFRSREYPPTWLGFTFWPTLEVQYSTPPTITQQPESQTVPAGSPATLTVTATGDPTLTYQWWKDGQALGGATSSSLPFDSVRSANAGVYSVVVTNATGSVRSDNATLTVTVPPTEFRGSVAVNLTPADCVTAGAQWRVNGGDWLDSGQTAIDVPAGSRLVEFKSVDGWKSPAAVQVRVIGNQVVSNTVAYSPVASLSLGSIPTQRIYEGTPAEFLVRSDELGAGATLAMTAGTPAPSGSLSFDPATGFFRYTPTATDKQPFTVTFIANLGTNTVSQEVSFQPVPGLPTERAVFGLTPSHPIPNDESTDYIEINTILGSSPEPFNHQMRTTRSIAISGKTVVFQQGHPNGLYEAYNENNDITDKSLG